MTATTSPAAALAASIGGEVLGPNTIATPTRTLAFYFGGKVRLIPGGDVIGNVSDGPERLAAAYFEAVGVAS